jgi:hypothetical protein
MHHLLWRDFTGGDQATLDPALLVDTYHKLGGKGQVLQPAVGRGFILAKDTNL